MDVQSDFFQGKPIEREVFLKLPKKASTNKVWRLKTIIYRLCDTPRTWYFSVKVGSINMGRVKSRYDDANFFWHNSQLLQGILSSHLDDYFWSETERFHKNVTDHNIRKKFAIKKEETQAFKYLGLNIAQEKTEICIHQKKYIAEKDCIKVDTPSQEELKLLHQEIQQLHKVN